MTKHPDRMVPLTGATNFRDLGGYVGRGGRPVRWRWLYRSDHLGHLTAADQAELQRRGLTRALDFRGVQESAGAAYSLPGLQRHALHIEPTVVQRLQSIADRGHVLDETTTVGLMEDLYRNVVRHQAPRLAQFFGHVLSADAPLVFHCTAGKDRTGLAAALLLRALGVPQDVVMQDFLLTNQVLRPPAALSHGLPDDVRRALWGVRASYLEAGLNAIEQDHGGIEPYLKKVVGLDEQAFEALARQCLAPA